jgi:MoxR-like ATPase
MFFSERFLEPRPLLRALREPIGCVLLVDEVDKADEEFESFLLEILSDYQVSIPELGTQYAKVIPIVLLTSNNTRDLGDAMKRRCLHLHIGYPDARREERIVQTRVPHVQASLPRQLVHYVQNLRTQDLRKLPSVSETIDWARALILLNASQLDPELVHNTLNVLLKHESDIAAVSPAIGKMVREATGPDARGRPALSRAACHRFLSSGPARSRA